MERAVITGATGAIGTALIKELIKNNTEVLVFCRQGSQRTGNIPVSPLVAVKYTSLDGLDAVQNDTGKNWDVFYHFAWAGTTGTARNDMQLQNLNVRYALDAVGAAKRFGCHTFIGAGSQAEYGRAEGKLRPDTPAFPENGYGMAKLCAGQMTRVEAHKYGLKHIWTRILSIYGENDGKNSMVMSLIAKLKNGETPQTTAGEQMWDYLYGGDAGRAFALLGDKGIDGKTYVIGSGNARPLKEYIYEIKNQTAPDGKINVGAVPYADKQVMYLCADITELQKDCGWTPKTEFEDGIKNILDNWE
ncbi:MAG: NAD(P)-dependent oxidoreductase [Firmicutes bacterium]|nr:NAD(P)-dependent oxidoreductase [Bacillota bacterium]